MMQSIKVIKNVIMTQFLLC